MNRSTGARLLEVRGMVRPSLTAFRLAALTLISCIAMAACSEKAAEFFLLTTGDLGVTVNGAPAGATVTVSQGGEVVASGTVGAQERVFEFLPVGTYTVTVTPPPGSQCSPQTQVVEVPSDDFVAIRFDCAPLTGNVAISVTGTTGPVTVGLIGPSGARTAQVTGTHTFTDLEPGTYTVSVSPPQGFTCSPSTQQVQVAPGGTATAEIDCMQQPGSIQATVIGGTAEVTVTGQGVTRTMTVGSSPVTYGNLPPGSYAVTITEPSGYTCAPLVRTVNVPAGGTASASFACMANAPTTMQIAGSRNVSYMIMANTCGVANPPPFQAMANFETVSPTMFNVRFADLTGFPIRISYDPTTGMGSGINDPVPQSSFEVTEEWLDLQFGFSSAGDVTLMGNSEVVYRLTGSTSEFCRLEYRIQF
jgi:hypothetical protein